MSARRIARVLARLASADAELRLDGDGPDYGIFIGRDRRRRALLRLSAAELRELESTGLVQSSGEGVFRLSAAGEAKVVRDAAAAGEEFISQHGAVVPRDVIDDDGAVRRVRGLDPEAPMRRLAALRGGRGEPWLSAPELAAAGKLRADWAVGEIGLVRGSDWMAAPGGIGRARRRQRTGSGNGATLRCTAACG